MTMRSSSFSAFPSFICLLIFISSISATCFYPDGSLPTDYSYSPCGNGAVEPCCTSYDDGVCVNGGLCKNDYNVYYIGACTDQTWGSSICPNYCKNESSIGDFVYVSSCGGTQWCCGSSTGSCCGGGTFTINDDVATTLSSTTTSSVTTPSPTTSPSSATTSSTPTATPTSTPKSSGLSAGDIGTIIGTVVGFLSIVVTILTIYYRIKFGVWINALVIVLSCGMCGAHHELRGGGQQQMTQQVE